jgi:hypothetical protein
MKTRLGFVSNSSSASFAVALCVLTPEQIAKAKDYRKVVLEMTVPAAEAPHYGGHAPRVWKNAQGQPTVAGTYLDPRWDVQEAYGLLRGMTTMNNFDFEDFLIRIGVPPEAIFCGGEG